MDLVPVDGDPFAAPAPSASGAPSDGSPMPPAPASMSPADPAPATQFQLAPVDGDPFAPPAPSSDGGAGSGAPPLTIRPKATKPPGLSYEDAVGPPPMNAVQDVAESAGSGVLKGIAAAPFGTSYLADMVTRPLVRAIDSSGRWALGMPQLTQDEQDQRDQAAQDFQKSEGWLNPLNLSNDVQGALDARLHAPQTTAGRYAETAGEFAPAALGGEGTMAQKLGYGVAAPTVGARVLGDYYADDQGNPNPYAEMAGAVLGGGVATGLARAATSNVAAPIFAKAVKTIAPTIGTALQERLAGQHLLRTASDPDQVRATLAQPSSTDQIIPKSDPTLYQLTGDQGIGQAERADSRSNPAPYLKRQGDQNAARLAAVRNMQPVGDPEVVAGHLADRMSAIDSAAQGRIDQARTGAQQGAGSIGQGAGPESGGAALRGHLDDANGIAKKAEGRLFDAIDPEGTLAVPSDNVTSAFNGAYGNLSDAAKAYLTPDERTLAGLVGNYAGVVPFREVADLRSNLAASMRSELSAKGRTPAYGRMSRLMGGVQDTINTAAKDRTALDNHLVSTGQMGEEISLRALLAQDINIDRPAEQVEARANTGTTDGAGSPVPSAYYLGSSGTQVSGGSEPGSPAGGQGLSQAPGAAGPAAPRQVGTGPRPDVAPFFDPTAPTRAPVRPDTPRPQSLHDFVRQMGGVNDDRGDLQSMGLNRLLAKPGNGVALDKAREAAAEAGYLGADTDHAVGTTDTNDLLNALEEGHRTYSVHDFDAAHAWDHYDQAKSDYDQARVESEGRSRFGQPQPRAPLSAYGQEDAYPLGMAPSQTAAPQRQINFDQAAADRVKAASAATRERKATFGAGAVGQVLFPGKTADSFRVPDSGVVGKIFPQGPKGYEAVKGYLQATGSTRQAVGTLIDAVAETLRQRAVSSTDGLLNPQTHALWKSQHANALRAIDEVVPGFSKRFDSTADATRAVQGEVQARTKALKDYQAGAVGKVMGATSSDEVVNRVWRAMNADDRVAQVGRLVKETQDNRDARAGLRRAMADGLSREFMSQTEAGTSGEKAIKANRFKELVSDLGPVLGLAYDPGEMQTFRDVADDLDRTNRSISGSKLPGGSDSIQNQEQIAKHGGGHGAGQARSLLSAVVTGAMGGHLLHGHGLEGALYGGGLGGLSHMLNTVRAAGIHDVQHFVSDALQNPARARQYVNRVPLNDQGGRAAAGILRRSLMTYPAAITANRDPQPQQRAAGGRVEPTDAQKEAGNYRKDHVRVQGLDIAIENAKGSERTGVSKDGHRWSVTMPADYGYIKGTEGADGDHVDCYVGPRPFASTVYVVDQIDLGTGRFDEHKCMIGFPSQHAAEKAYEHGFSDGKGHARMGKVTPMQMEPFKRWVRSEATLKRTAARAMGGRVGLDGLALPGTMTPGTTGKSPGRLAGEHDRRIAAETKDYHRQRYAMGGPHPLAR